MLRKLAQPANGEHANIAGRKKMPGILIIGILIGFTGGIAAFVWGAPLWMSFAIYVGSGAGIFLALFGAALLCGHVTQMRAISDDAHSN